MLEVNCARFFRNSLDAFMRASLKMGLKEKDVKSICNRGVGTGGWNKGSTVLSVLH